MEWIAAKIVLPAKLLALVLLLFTLSPGPSAVATRRADLALRLSSLDGEVRIVIQKSRNVLTLYKGMTPVRSYWAALGRGWSGGDKQRSGDKRTPEGDFYVCSMNPSERFYKFMGISYPGLVHAESAMQGGLITYGQYLEIWKAIVERRQPPWDTRLGGAIGIHGRVQGPAVRRAPNPENWTDGCIALNNDDVDELFGIASLGTPVTILP